PRVLRVVGAATADTDPLSLHDALPISRRLLARMHSYSRRSRRGGVEPATAQDLMRFLLRWQHVAPGTQLAGEAGLLTVIEQLQGDRKSTRLNSSHRTISYAVFCLKKKI